VPHGLFLNRGLLCVVSRSDRLPQLFSNVIPSHLSQHRTAAVAMHAQKEINAISSHFNAKDFNTNVSEHT